MRILLASLFLSAATACLAQTAAAPPPNDAQTPQLQSGAGNASSTDLISTGSANLCYALRVYSFTRQDGTERQSGERTCTPSQRFRATYIPSPTFRVKPRSTEWKPPKSNQPQP